MFRRRRTNATLLIMLTKKRFALCESRHDALVRVATRSTPGYAVSGAVVVVCSRHCMIWRNGAGDLQLGEKYVLFYLYSLPVLIACHLDTVMSTSASSPC